jgi:uncharacterized protein YjbI with pentapeptide repeats
LVLDYSGYDIDLDYVDINGDLILSVAEAIRKEGQSTDISFEDPKYITSHIRFHNCYFNGLVDLSNVIFAQEISFCGSHFKEDAFFCPIGGGMPLLKATQFQVYTDFSFTNFDKFADFGFVQFKGDTSFKQAVFRESANHVDFSGADFDGKADFDGTIFDREARFLGTQFHGITTFSSGTRFERKAVFADALFYEEAWFYDVRFEDEADFRHVYFDRDAIFTHSKFSKDFLLNESRIKIMNLDSVEFAGSSIISLAGSYFDRLVKMEYPKGSFAQEKE